ncbi:putative phosphoglycerate mutase [Frankia sp. EI5c]|uniref:histidine phosphatase family protein n=1 Tax=Frankia sp. EI5c TaxID=683316 RepID=UPI0007C20C5D|nr:histidine phosphatase family protein [Frankia sp. EI5c]OAA27752.1 putative phosphoglycerate mutase [Frankia sp. EI5c]
MRLMLLRHGQTPYNVAGALDTGRPGAELTALGHAQARALPHALRGETISAIYASVLIRTQLTAAPLAEARELRVAVTEGIEEITAGDLELRSDRDSITTYLDVVSDWINGDLTRTMPGGQSGQLFVAGYDAAIANIAAAHDEDDAVLVVSHGAAIRAWVGIRAGGVGSVEDRWLSNTGMVTLEGDPAAGWNLVQWHGEPRGGAAVPDLAAHDVTGAPVGEAVAEDRAAG